MPFGGVCPQTPYVAHVPRMLPHRDHVSCWHSPSVGGGAVTGPPPVCLTAVADPIVAITIQRLPERLDPLT